MSRSLAELWYELVLLTYPKGYRAEHGADIMGALMAVSELPSIRETVVRSGRAWPSARGDRRARVSLPLAVAVAVSTGRVMMFGGDVTEWGSSLLGPSYHNWVSLIPYGLLAAGAAVLAVRRPPRGRRDARAGR